MKENKKNREKDAAQQEAQAQEAPPQPDPDAPAQDEEEKITITRQKLEELNAYVKQAESKRDEYLAAAQRVQADFDNYRKRNAALRTEVAEDTLRDTLKEILPSLDNLERALSAAQAAGEEGSLIKGVEMTLRGMQDTLGKMGLERVEAEPGVLFDPERHNAVMMSEADDEHPEGTILECFQTGFAVKGKVIRYAMVRVAN